MSQDGRPKNLTTLSRHLVEMNEAEKVVKRAMALTCFVLPRSCQEDAHELYIIFREVEGRFRVVTLQNIVLVDVHYVYESADITELHKNISGQIRGQKGVGLKFIFQITQS